MQNAECKMQNAKFSAANRRDGTYGTNETYGVRSQTHHPLVPLVLLVSLVSYLLCPLSTLNSQLLTNMECLDNCICR